MISIECYSIIEHPRAEVFEAGIDPAMLPRNVEGFGLQFMADRIDLGVPVKASISGVDPLPALKLKGEVKEFVPNELVLVRVGAFAMVNADVKLALSDYKRRQTRIDYGIYVTPKNPIMKAAEPLVESVLHERVALFSDGYSGNVSSFLDAAFRTTTPRRRQKAA